MTKREMFTTLATIVEATEVENKAELLSGLAHEIELLNKKASSGSKKPTPTQVENENFKAEILRVLSESAEPLSIKQIKGKSETLGALEGSQKISALLIQLKKSGQVVRSEVKKIAYFALAE